MLHRQTEVARQVARRAPRDYPTRADRPALVDRRAPLGEQAPVDRRAPVGEHALVDRRAPVDKPGQVHNQGRAA